jgi:hypothetical protein
MANYGQHKAPRLDGICKEDGNQLPPVLDAISSRFASVGEGCFFKIPFPVDPLYPLANG